jgi:hypothetical protein
MRRPTMFTHAATSLLYSLCSSLLYSTLLFSTRDSSTLSRLLYSLWIGLPLSALLRAELSSDLSTCSFAIAFRIEYIPPQHHTNSSLLSVRNISIFVLNLILASARSSSVPIPRNVLKQRFQTLPTQGSDTTRI